MLTLRRRTYVISSALLIVLGMMGGVVFAITTHFAGAQENVEAIDLSTVQEDAIKNLYDADGRMKNPHREMQNDTKDYSGGFGGYYFDPANPTTAYVYMKDTTKAADAEDAFRAAYPNNSKYTRIMVVPGSYSVDDLTDWYYQAVAALDSASNVTLTSSSMNIMGNGFRLTVDSDDGQRAAWAIIDDLSIPRGAVSLTVGRATFLADGNNVDAKWRPVVGGVKVEGPTGCTIGFVTIMDGEEGMVVASHCTNTSRAVGGNNNAWQYQPDDDEIEVGREEIDPALGHVVHDLCPSGATNCRYSDAAYVDARDIANIIDRGKIAKPQLVGTKSVNPAYSTFSITSDLGAFHVGDTINYVGMRRGWRQGTVEDTCAQITYSSPSARIICTGKVSVTGNSVPQNGDSGAPVFLHENNQTKILGTITGRVSGEDFSHFSKIGFIYQELDNGVSWETCSSGC